MHYNSAKQSIKLLQKLLTGMGTENTSVSDQYTIEKNKKGFFLLFRKKRKGNVSEHLGHS